MCCKRFGWRNLKICGEKLSSDTSSAEIFINEFISITEGYSEHQIFNCDETGLYFKMLPGHALASVNDRPERRRQNTG